MSAVPSARGDAPVSSPTSGKLQRPESLTELVVKEIRTRIVEGTLQLGETISENALALELGVSKTPVRDAMQRLRAERLVDILPSRGTVVFSLGADQVEQLSVYRSVLETAAVRLSMTGDRKAFVASLTAIVESMRAARAGGDLPTYRRLDAAFHRAFFTCSGNKYLVDAYSNVEVQIQALRTRLSTDPKHIEDSYKEHLQMLAAAKAGKAADLVEIVSSHIDNTMKSFKIVIERLGTIS